MRSSSSRIGAAAVVCALGLVAAACGGDDDTETASTAAPATSGAAAATTAASGAGASTTRAGATTTRSGSTATSAAGGTSGASADNPSGFGTAALSGPGPYGQDPADPDLYLGAGDFVLDISDCPSDYDIDQGITDSEIKIAQSLPRSGPLAGFGLLGDGMKSYFQYINETQGGIDGREIIFDDKDDAYEPARTKTNVDELVQSGEYAALVTILGTANNLGVWDDLNEECMPHLLTSSGVPQWGDVENHPWSTGLLLDYFTEAQLWAEWVEANYPDGATVAAITYNNDFGQSYSKGFRDAIEGTNIELVAEELHDPSTPNLTNQFTTLSASDADVLLIQTTGTFCTQAMAEVEKSAWDPEVMASSTCASLTQFFQPLIDQGLTGDGTHLLQFFKDPNDPANADDPFVQLFKETLTAQGLDPTQVTYFNGWIYAWYATEIMRLATTLEGGLNRPNLVIANRSIEAQNPALLDGILGRMEGLKDAYITEAGLVVQYTVDDPNVLGSYVPEGELINKEGEGGTYADVTG